MVCYDICDDTRLRKVYKIMKGHGQWVQYSVFRCELSDRERLQLMTMLQKVINHRVDQVMFIDLGPSGHQDQRFETMGRPLATSPRSSVII
jgi:CRISPR-associated protein Cas2